MPAPAQARFSSASLKCSGPRTKTAVPSWIGVPSPFVPMLSSEKSKPSAAFALSNLARSLAPGTRRATICPVRSAKKIEVFMSCRVIARRSNTGRAALASSLSASNSSL